MPISQRTRRLIVRLLGRLPGQCGADLAMWAHGATQRRSPWSPRTGGCTYDAVRTGHCRCTKLGRDGSIHRAGEVR